jgi:hypothetical protein
MSEDWLKELRQQPKDDAMVPRTYRLPPKIDKEIRVFCRENNIQQSAFVRLLIEKSWKALNG